MAEEILGRPVRNEDDEQERRAERLAQLYGTTPNTYAGINAATRQHAERTAEDSRAAAWTPLGPRNVGGAIRCLAIRQPIGNERQLNLPIHLLAGSAQGGLWKSEDAGYSWAPAGAPGIAGAVGSVAWSTRDRRVVYVGTGDVSVRYPGGTGFYRSKDGGVTFDQLVDAASGDPGSASHYPRIVIDPNDEARAWIASNRGLWRLEGSRFVQEIITGVPAGNGVTDVALTVDPANANQYFLLVGMSGLGVAIGTYDRQRKSTAWSVTAGAGPWPAIGNVRVAWAVTAPVPTAHAIMEDLTPPAPSHDATPLFTSTNLGVAWAAAVGAVSPEVGGNIAWYALTLAAHPTTPAMVFVGSTDLYRTLNGGVNWVRVLDWTQYDNGDRAQHGDVFAVVFDTDAVRRAWVCNDGGISTSDNIGAAVVVWRKRSYGISAAQLFDISTHPAFPQITGGGMQDNGTFVSYGGPTWYALDGGDGGAMAFHPTSPYRFYTSWQGDVDRVDVSTFGAVAPFQVRVPDVAAPNNVVAPYNEALGVSAPGTFFIRAVAAHPVLPDFVLIGSQDALQYTNDGRNLATANMAPVVAPPPNHNYTTAAFATIGGDMWAGTNRGEVLLNTAALPPSGAGGVQPAWTMPLTVAGAITAIVVHPTNSAVVAVATALSGGTASILLTHNRGVNWDRIDAAPNGLPASPFLALAWDPSNLGTLFVGTASGVYVARDLPGVGALVPGAVPAPTWRTFNRGLPAVPVMDLEVSPITRTLRCATFGRGAYEATLTGTTPAAFVIPPVSLLIRDHAADDGRTYPAANTLGADPRLGVIAAPAAAPAVLTPPAPSAAGPIDVTHSIDIRVDSPRFFRSEAFAFGEAIDGAEFDETLVRDQPLVGDINIVYVQVQNRGSAVATNADVHLYFADAGNPVAVPAIDAAFGFPAPPGPASPWRRADTITVGNLTPGQPAVVAFRWIPPLSIVANVALLAIVSGGQDLLAAVPAGPTDAFVRAERRAALHVLSVQRDTIFIRDGLDDGGDRGAVAWGARSPDIIVRQARVPAATIAAEFANLADAHSGDAAHTGANFVYVRVHNRTQVVVPRSTVRLFRISRGAVGVPGPSGLNWKEVTPAVVLAGIPAGSPAIAEFSMPLPVAPETDPDPDSPTDGKGIILLAMANVVDGAGVEVDPFPDFATVTSVVSFWRFFSGAPLATNSAMRALRFIP